MSGNSRSPTPAAHPGDDVDVDVVVVDDDDCWILQFWFGPTTWWLPVLVD
jgi:hypothetical protein